MILLRGFWPGGQSKIGGVMKRVISPIFGLSLALAPLAQATEMPVTAQAALQRFQSGASGVTCSGGEYDAVPAGVALKSACMSCKSQLASTQGSLNSQVQAAIAQYGSATGAGVTSVGAAPASTATTQVGRQAAQVNGAGAGAAAASARAAASQAAAKAFQTCSSSLSGCSGIGSQQAQADQAKQACNDGQKTSSAAAADQTAKGMSMGEMAQMAGQAAGLLGPLAQMMQKKGGGETASSNPYTPTSSTFNDPSNSSASTGTATPTQLTGTNLSDPAVLSSANIGNAEGASTVATSTSPPTFANGGGYNPAASSSSDEDDSIHRSVTVGSGLDGGGGGGFDARGGGMSAMGGGGGANASGSSRMGEKTDAAAKAAGEVGAFEIPSGGSSKPAFLGLKSRGTELAELEGAGGAEASVLAELAADQAEEGDRGLASQGADIHTDGTGTLFTLVKAKYLEIKKRGKI